MPKKNEASACGRLEEVVPIERVLALYGITLKRSGAQLIGKGFNIPLSALPVNGRLALREPNDEQDDKAASKPARRK